MASPNRSGTSDSTAIRGSGSATASEVSSSLAPAPVDASGAGGTVAARDDDVAGPTFGAQGGVEIRNKGSVLAEVDAALGRGGRPPAIEYILVMPFAMLRLPFGLGISYNSYGHAAVRYTRGNGEQVVMNIVGKKSDAVMVQFAKPEEYMFGTAFDRTTEQRGVYNRAMITVRVEDVPAENVEAMHEFFMQLRDQSGRQEAKFNIVLSPIYNFLASLRLPIAQRGNCAWWTSQGLKKAGVVTHTSLWPKSIFCDMFENSHRTAAGSPANVHVVSYRRIRHAQLSYGIDAEPVTAVAPLQSFRSLAYWNLERFANVVVDVPPGRTTAVITKQNDPAQPSWLRNMANSKLVIASSVFLTAWALAGAVGLRRGGGARTARRMRDAVREWPPRLRTRRTVVTYMERGESAGESTGAGTGSSTGSASAGGRLVRAVVDLPVVGQWREKLMARRARMRKTKRSQQQQRRDPHDDVE